MTKQVVSIKAAKIEKQYKEFYSSPLYRELSKRVFFSKEDTVKKVKIS